MNIDTSALRRFWSAVDIDGPIQSHTPELGPCWQWLYKPTIYGYGQLNVGGRKGRPFAAHRISWVIHHGSIQDDKFVCHKCDNRLCVNPDHLFIGDALSNTQDMDVKGRRVSSTGHNKGVINGQAKLTEDQVLEIRQLVDGGTGYSIIATRYGICMSSITAIKQRKTWAHI